MAAQAQKQLERLLRAGPELANQLLVAAKQVSEDEGQDDRIVELARQRDEVGHEVDGKSQIARRQREKQLAPARDARIAQEASN